MKFIKQLLNIKTLVEIKVSSRDLKTIHRYIAKGWKVVFKGAIAVLSKLV